jgi:hypothetical protein
MKGRDWLVLGAALFVLGVIKLSLVGWYLLHREIAPEQQAVECPAMSGQCPLPGGQKLLFIDRPVEGHAFRLALEGDFEHEPAAEFTMRSMDMGFNRYRFIRANGRWEASVTLPACVSGRRDWMMTLDLPGRRVIVPLQVK